MEVLRFENPDYFYALLIIPIFWFLLVLHLWSKKKKLQEYGDFNLIEKLTPKASNSKLIIKTTLFSLAFASLALALVNPQTGSKLETIKRKGVDLVINIDVSNSMLAEDIQPNRLERSKIAILNLIDELKGDRIGINVFAGNSYPLLPITTDYTAAKMFLDNVETGYVNTQGTNLASAIELSMGSFEISEDFEKENNKAIILITDGEDHEPGAVDMAKKAKEMGIKVYTIGIGRPNGAPIPIYKHGIRTDYKRDKDGNTVITKLNEENLKNIAKSGDGIYVRASNSKTGLKDIFNEISKMNQQEIEAKVFKEYNDKFYLFLGLALFFFLLDAFITEKKSKFFKFFNV